MSRLTRTLLVTIVLVLAVAGGLLFWSSRRPPAIARMLPEADAILYADLRPARLATHFDRTAPARSAGYQDFVNATGIAPERDLDEAAFALTRRSDPTGPSGPVAYTEVLKGRFDADRLTAYLARSANSQEQYAGRTIYVLPSDDPGLREPRLLRVVLLKQGLLAASNAATPEQIHAVIDRAGAGLFGAPQPSLLASRFREVPSLAMAWGIGSLGLPFTESGHVAVLGLQLPFPADQPMVASVRYVGVVRVRIAALAPTPELAMQQAGALSGLLGLARTLGSGAKDADPGAAAAINSITVSQDGARTVLTVDLPTPLLRQMTGQR